MINLQLLINTLSIQTKSNEQEEMIEYVKSFLDTINLSYTRDTYGNIYVTKGTGTNGYRCIVSHLDTVHSRVENRKIYKQGDILFAFGNHINSTYKDWSQCGVNGDDSVGVYLCLHALLEEDDLKVVFFLNEEIGRLGSNQCDITFFKDCNLVLQPDRKGNSDFINISAGIEMCSKEFLELIKDDLTEHKYKVATGVATDVDVLKKRGVDVCCANISCGYYEAHTDNEYVSLKDIANCQNLIKTIFTKYGFTKQSHTYVAPVYTFGQTYTLDNTSQIPGFNTLLNDLTKFHFCDGLKSFGKKYQYNNTYGYIKDKPIHLNNYKCSECGEEHVYFLPNEEFLMCTSKHCHNFKYDPRIINEITVKDDNGKDDFVYSVFNAAWLKKNQARFDKTQNSWVTDWSKLYEHNDDEEDYSRYYGYAG